MQAINALQSHDNILVLGAGELGMSVIRAVIEATPKTQQVQVTVMLRSRVARDHEASKKRDLAALEQLGVEILEADIAHDSIDVLAAHFARFDTVIGCVGFVAGAGTQLKLARAALASGVKRYVPWQFGVDYDVIGRGSPQNLFDEQLDVRDLLRAQHATEWIIISTGMFTSFLFEPAFGVVDLAQNTVGALGSWDTQVTVTTPEDIGALTAQIIFTTPRIANEVVYTAGDTLTYRQLADSLDKQLGRSVSRIEWSVPELKRELAAAPDDQMKKYRAVFAEGKGVAWHKHRTFNAARNISVTTVSDWIDQNVVVNRQRHPSAE